MLFDMGALGVKQRSFFTDGREEVTPPQGAQQVQNKSLGVLTFSASREQYRILFTVTALVAETHYICQVNMEQACKCVGD